MARQKFGGRIKGTANKTTAEIRQHFQNLVSNNLDQLDSDLKALEPFQRLKVVIELSRFVIPQLKSTDLIIEQPHTNIISLGAGVSPEKAEQIMREEVKRINDEVESRY